MERNGYSQKIGAAAPGSPVVKNCCKAFLSGGLICTLGEALFTLYARFGAGEKEASAWVCVTLVFLTALLTGIGVFDKIAKHAGAGTMVPITGFANAVASPAIEFKTEGWVTGLAVKIFTIAGPVLVFGSAASVIYGIILCLIS